MEPPTCLIDGFGPLLVVSPPSASDLGDLVRAAHADGQALYPVGGGTHLGVGLPPARPGRAVSLRGWTQVIDYPARDMTITVQAGLPLAELQRLLAAENQRLPIDVPRPERATLGGALATNASGPRRLGFGTLRDYVIGLSWIDDGGHEVKAGGRVVKNVAGYDLCKLHVGALGTLGILTQVTLKVRPRPETQALLTVPCEPGRLEEVLGLLHQGRTRPACVDLLNRRAARALADGADLPLPPTPWVVVVGYEDSEDAVSWQVQQAVRELGAAGVAGVEARAGAAGNPLWDGLTALTESPDATLTFKATLLPGNVSAFCARADELPEGLLVYAHAGSGVVYGHATGALTAARAAEMLKELLAQAQSAQGNLTVPHAPPAWKRDLPVWGAPRGDAGLMRRVKEQLDPRGLFNPGRFVAGM